MQNQNILSVSVAVAICVIFAMAFAVPLMLSFTTSNVTTDNSGGWVKLAYAEDATATDYNFEITVSGDTVAVGSMSGQSDTVIYADDIGSIVAVNGALSYISQDGKTELGSNVTVTNSAGTLTVSDGVSTVTATPAWSYYPSASGTFASCSADGIKTTGEQFAAVGYFAGVYTYNDYIAPDLNLVLEETVEDDIISSVLWVKVE